MYEYYLEKATLRHATLERKFTTRLYFQVMSVIHLVKQKLNVLCATVIFYLNSSAIEIEHIIIISVILYEIFTQS